MSQPRHGHEDIVCQEGVSQTRPKMGRYIWGGLHCINDYLPASTTSSSSSISSTKAINQDDSSKDSHREGTEHKSTGARKKQRTTDKIITEDEDEVSLDTLLEERKHASGQDKQNSAKRWIEQRKVD